MQQQRQKRKKQTLGLIIYNDMRWVLKDIQNPLSVSKNNHKLFVVRRSLWPLWTLKIDHFSVFSESDLYIYLPVIV